jgi:peptidyl-prolyl cis-trans isomerase C
MTLVQKLLGGVALAVLSLSAAAAQEAPATEAPATEAPATEAPATEAPATEAPANETPATPVTADTVVATVNGTEITLGQMIVMRARLPEQYQQMPDDALFSGILDQLIQQLALTGDGTVELSRGSALALENERRSLLAGEALTKVAEAAATDDALKALYDERYASAAPAQEYNASHILVETEDEAKAIKAQIDGGADFATVAKEQSTGPSGPNGGDLGWFSEGMMVEPFEQAVMAMQAGDISEPVQTQFGWHVIRLNEVRLKEAPALDEVRDELTADLQRQAIEKAIADATAAADVVRSDVGIDPAVLRDLDLLKQ